jgi:hypothetical protein
MTKVVLAVALAVLALAGTALAERGPTKTERAAIRAAVKGYVQMPGSPAAKDNTILSVSVSTLDPRYAVARLNSKSAGRADLLFHESHATWWAVGFGSSMGCDSAPKAVLADLRVGCDPPYATAWINDCGALVSAPKSFVLTCADANYELAALNWHAWGTPTALHSPELQPGSTRRRHAKIAEIAGAIAQIVSAVFRSTASATAPRMTAATPPTPIASPTERPEAIPTWRGR